MGSRADVSGASREARVLMIGLALCAVMASWRVEAQDDSRFAKPTKEQLELYESGFEAYKEGQYERAVERFEASLKIGEMNITYLNLGRALFKVGRCKEAFGAYDKVSVALQVQEPSPAQVLDKLDEYRQELKGCPGVLAVDCKSPESRVEVSGGRSVACGGRLELPPGQYEVVGRLGDKVERRSVVLVSMEVAQVSIELVGAAPVGDGGGGDGAGLRVAGWISAGVGAAALVGAGSIFVLNSTDANRFEELNQSQLACPGAPECIERDALKVSLDGANTQIGLSAAVGAVAMTTGVVLLVLGYSAEGEGDELSGVEIIWSPAMVGVRGNF